MYFGSVLDVLTIISFSVTSLGIVGNLLVLLIILCTKKLRTKMYIFIGNLALADLCYLAHEMVAGFMMNVPKEFFMISTYVTFVTFTVSIHTLVLLAIDKFLTLVLVFKSIVFKTSRNLLITVALLWAISISLLSPAVIFFGDDPGYFIQKGPYITVNKTNNTDTTPFKTIFICLFVLDYLVPLIAITVMYAKVIFQLNSKDRPNPVNNPADSKIIKDKRRLTIVMIIVTVVFAVCWFPRYVDFYLLFFTEVDNTNESYEIFSAFAYFSVLINSAINPILYAFIYVDFRQQAHNFFKQIRTTCCKKK
ncbi:galanin receptor type 1 [Lingula anatina]|uniref:Galanin receptor type 1 n=1 Tax=Lingula anatina TaxID=7574 RepID=A0A1S3IY67_LINAN|nr:galanin receptor type 1 [Lingula anatina]XP_013402931.1 galanin receptor type 1 [Lingula anatina]XP_013402932.1 galanin receptor type 1 [Lingula anatina]|eukprot:XP_013402930.1 galanin receptor type 1 [Lingula anatina]